MKEVPGNVSESVKRLNPHLYGPHHQNTPVLGGLLPAKPKPNKVHSLDPKPKINRHGPRRVALVVSIIRVGKALLDDDNLTSCNKGLRDAIARTLGVDDRDPRIKWEYGQVETRHGASAGSIVKIERV